ncbi:nuclease-related domain-containing protein [Planococcus sp. FY231025]|uniref:nuclease-related domain-containing protein n=1 Tax=Planococcus sp. FY231025 TaxID=3455699 RepID=UPI003F9226BE
MFMKTRSAPALLHQLPRLMHRLPHMEAIRDDHYKIRAGFGGEEHVDSILLRSRPSSPVSLIGDLQLANRFCQIDTIVVTDHFVLILEVKNFSGTLSFNEDSYHLEQTTREGNKYGYNSPVTQVWNAREELRMILSKAGLACPVYGAIVLPYPSTLVDRMPSEFPVVYGYSLNRFISTLPRTGRISSPERTAQLLIDQHQPFPKMDFQEAYKYDPSQLKKGVLCGKCGSVCQKMSERLLLCRSCKQPVEDGYRRALDDWFDFVSPEITNAQCREFLGLKDKYAANYLLKKMDFLSQGASHQTIYRKREAVR